jgi:hypothetical protein
MVQIVNVADLTDPDDPQGRSYRQVNADKQHAIAIDTLVELTEKDGSYGNERLYVKQHARDCDQTPLYSLGLRHHESPYQWVHGFSEDSLTVVSLPTA